MAVYFLPKSRMKKFLARTDLPPDVVSIDVSSKASAEWAVLTPGFDHGDIPVPGMAGAVSRTVDGIWEGLKRFEHSPEDLTLLEAPKPKKRKLTTASGKLVGHLYQGDMLKDEIEARKRIWLPAYTWMLQQCPAAREKFDELVELARTKTIHLYDTEENGDLHDARPLAHAAVLAELVKEARKKKKAAAAAAQV
jgi:hypothetical protein